MNNNSSFTETLKCRTCQIIPDHEWLLHHVYKDKEIIHNNLPSNNVNRNSNYSRLCTSCVLKHNRGLFCPSCFSLIDASRSLDDRHVICLKCKSRSHRGCVPASVNINFYTCPPCSDSNYTFFDVKTRNGDNVVKAIDEKWANAFLSAANIAMASMSKAAVLARNEAENKVNVALLYRRKAREALQHLSELEASKALKRQH